ncbi:hypothetical protein TNCV_4971461 [Trichonephila clavipes]|nr:hypothetical protein TNCV_4971461 [Trichonephila clavipes]
MQFLKSDKSAVLFLWNRDLSQLQHCGLRVQDHNISLYHFDLSEAYQNKGMVEGENQWRIMENIRAPCKMRFGAPSLSYKAGLSNTRPTSTSFVNPTPLAHTDTSREVLPRGGISQEHFKATRGLLATDLVITNLGQETRMLAPNYHTNG